MFTFLKDKLKSAISVFSRRAEEAVKDEPAAVEQEAKEEIAAQDVSEELPAEEEAAEKPVRAHEEAEPKEEPDEEAKEEAAKEEMIESGAAEVKEEPIIRQEEPGFFSRIRQRFKGKEEQKPLEPKGILSKVKEAVTTRKICADKFEELFSELEMALLENNVAVEAIDKIKSDLKQGIVEKPIAIGKVQSTITSTLKVSLKELLSQEKIDLAAKAGAKKPFVICFFGVNGSGKTTTIAKIAKLLQDSGLSIVMAAADTFRAAAIDQLSMHAEALGAKLIKHDYGSDSAAVAFDAIRHAQSRAKDVVLIDTAGRMHSNTNLMDELKKVVRVAKPDLKIFVGESITGNDCVEQARQFNEAIGIDAIVLTKADVDEKGGAAVSISYVTGKPIIFLGTGQKYDDLKAFSPDIVMSNLGLAA